MVYWFGHMIVLSACFMACWVAAVRAMVSDCHKKWAEAAGAKFAVPAAAGLETSAVFEIAPALSYDGEGLSFICAGKGGRYSVCQCVCFESTSCESDPGVCSFRDRSSV